MEASVIKSREEIEGYWKDDGDGLSYSLWESKETYDNFCADTWGQVDLMMHPTTFTKKWRAIAYKLNDSLITDWFTDRDSAIAFVNRNYSH